MQKQLNRLAVVVAVVGIIVTSMATTGRAANVTWNIAGGGNWDTSTPNWTGDSTFYTEGDAVTFNNSAGGTINLTANHNPASTTISAASGTYTFSGSSITSGNIFKSGSGSLDFNVTYTPVNPTIEITGGTIQLMSPGVLPNTVSFLGLAGVNNGLVDFNGYDQVMRNLGNRILHYTDIGNITVNGGNDFWGGSTIDGNGSLTFSPTHTTTTYGASSTYTGGTFIQGGTVAFYGGNAAQFPLTGEVTISSPGTLNLNYHNSGSTTKTIGALFGTGSVLTSSSNAAGTVFRIGNGGGSGTFFGVYSGNGSLVKLGTGTEILNGNNSYTGTTTISGGKLVVNGITGPNQGNYTVQANATLGGNGTINLAGGSAVTVQANGILEPGLSPGTLTINGGLNLNNGAILNMELGNGGDTIVVNGLLTGSASAGGITLNLLPLFDVGVFVLLDWTGGSVTGLELTDFNVVGGAGGTLAIIGSQLVFTIPAPEPTSFSLLGLGLLALVRKGGRRAKTTASLA